MGKKLKKYDEYILEYKNHSVSSLTDEEYDYFGSFCQVFHKIPGVVIWFGTDEKFDYVKVSNNLNSDPSGEDVFKINLKNYIVENNDLKNDTISKIIDFLKLNKDLIDKYYKNEIDDFYFLKNVKS